MISKDRVRELFDYQDGNLIRKVSIQSRSRLGEKAGANSTRGVVIVSVDYKRYKAHRLIWLWHHGSLPPVIDHIDGDPTNNRIENLRPATHATNMRNSKKPRTNTSGFKGVRFHKQRQKWTAQISVNNRSLYLGIYETPELAYAAYCAGAAEHHGEFARLA
jgi:hypothetical protein